MIVEGQRGNLGDEDGSRDRFPVGMRVLAVDDDPICLKVLENLLRKCQYHVTTTNQAITALKMLRENRNNFDLVISDVNMPDMDGFKLLEHVGLEMDLPVIMLSAHSDTKLVMKGVTHGACDYLLKPVRIEELKNIWQHVVRRRKFDCKDQNRPPNDDRNRSMGVEGSQGIASENNVDQAKTMGKKRKDQGEDEEEEGEENGQENEDPSAQKKPRVVWSVDLHRKFVTAVHQLGLEKAVPKKILDLMNVEGLTRENVASHLQKYRLYLKKATHHANNINASLGSTESSYLRMGSLDGFGDFRTLSGSGRVSSTALSAYASGGMFSRLNSPAGLSIRGISSSSLIRAGQNPNMNSSINTLGNIQPSIFPGNQSSNLYQGIPTSIELNQSQQSNRATNIRQLNPIDNSSGFTVGTSFPDNRVSIVSPNNSVSGVSNSQLMLHGTSQQAQNTGAFRNQSFLRGASSAESFDIGGSSNLLDYSRCNERLQGAAQLSRFPSNTLSVSETFCSDQLPPSSLNISSTNPHIGNNAVDFSSPSANAVPLDNARGELQCQEGLIGNVVQASTYTQRQGWEEHKQDYNQSMNHNFNSINPLFPTNGVTSSMMQSSNHNNNAMYSKRADASLVGQLNGAVPSLTQRIEIEKFSSDTRMKPNEAYILEQIKSQDNFIQNNYGSLDDIMSGMVKREHNEMLLMNGEIGFEAYPIGSCI